LFDPLSKGKKTGDMIETYSLTSFATCITAFANVGASLIERKNVF